MKKLDRISARLLSLSILFLLMCFGNDHNPYLEAKPGAVVQSRSFEDGDEMSVFSTESITVKVNLKERVERVAVNISSNRLWSGSDSVIESSEFSEEPFTFRFSFSDTGTQGVTVNSFLDDGTTSLQTFSFHVTSPLFQDMVRASQGDTIRLSTPAVEDQVTYVWDLHDGTVLQSDDPNAEFILDAPFESKIGELYVVSDGVRSPSCFFDLMQASPGRPAVRFLTRVHDFPSTLTVGRDELDIDLKVNPQTGVEPYRFDAFWVGENETILHDSSDGLLRWIPDQANLGTYHLKAIVTDNMNTSDTLDVQIEVVEPKTVDVSFSQEESSVSETGHARIVVALSEETQERITVPISIDWDRSTAAGEDVTLSASEVEFSPGETEKHIPLSVTNDDLIEDVETVCLLLHEPDGYAVLGGIQEHVLYIQDDDRLNIYFHSAASRVEEAVGECVINLSLSQEFSSSVSVRLRLDSESTSAQPVHYNLPSDMTLTFAPGETRAEFVLGITDNLVHEPDRTVALRLENESPHTSIVGNSVHTVTIVDDDPESREIGFADGEHFGSESMSSVPVKVILSHPFPGDVTVGYETSSRSTASEGEDFNLPSPKSLTFLAGEVEKVFHLEIIDDESIESDELIVLELVDLPEGVTPGTDTYTFTINDNDAPEVVQVGFESGASQGAESSASVRIRVLMSSSSRVSVAVPVAVSEESSASAADYTLQTDELVFRPGETEKAVLLNVSNNRQKDGERTVVLELGDPSAYARLGNSRHIYTIRDNDCDVQVNVVPENAGRVFLQVDGETETAPFESGTDLTVSAMSGEGYQFDHWSGDLSGNTNPSGLYVDSDKSVTVHFTVSGPQIHTQPENQEIQEGETARFSVGATGENLTYRWQKDGADIQGADGFVLEVGPVSLEDDGAVYTCVVSNSSGRVDTDGAVLCVSMEPPQITAQPQSSTVRAEDTAVFTVSAQGSELVYRWYKDGVQVGGNENRLSFVAGQGDTGAEFFCIVENGGGSVTSETAVLTVIVGPPRIEENPQDHSALEGEEVRFAVWAPGTDLRYQWQRDDQDIE
ncbi:MAG: Calx-beta domain-containing protein [Chitinispirillaceae bacterium]